MSKVVALLGVSGVGKTRLVRELSVDLVFQHLQASLLIKKARENAASEVVAHDSLREFGIDDNQKFLVDGFKSTLDQQAHLVILDGHSVIDTSVGLVPISPDVFEALNVKSIIFVADDANEINLRRSKDRERFRPHRDVEFLQQYQNLALLQAAKIAMHLSVPLLTVTPIQRLFLLKYLQSI